MGSYQIRWKGSAARELKKLPQTTIQRVLDTVEALSVAPRPHGARRLVGTEHTYRLRVGDYRIVYTVEDDVLLVHIIRVGHRRDVYR
jgi:mRNA interferase RelE/StbE